MMRAIQQDRLPHFLVLTYDSDNVSDLVLIPRFALSPSAIEPRRALSPTARRAGWVGCNIVISHIPPEGRIFIVESGCAASRESVRDQFQGIGVLSNVAPSSRGWTLDVLTGLRGLGRRSFTLQDAYTLQAELAALHPLNKNIRPKIRQQLQVLRDLGFLQFVERGLYEFI
jgi:type II restriction enzyme